MEKEKRSERIQDCKKYVRCSFSICPLDPEGNGCYVEGDPICPLVKPDSEDRTPPLIEAVLKNRATKRVKPKNKPVTREITANKELRAWNRDKTPQITSGKVVLRTSVDVG